MTVTEFAKLNGVSRTAVYRRLQRDPACLSAVSTPDRQWDIGATVLPPLKRPGRKIKTIQEKLK